MERALKYGAIPEDDEALLEFFRQHKVGKDFTVILVIRRKDSYGMKCHI